MTSRKHRPSKNANMSPRRSSKMLRIFKVSDMYLVTFLHLPCLVRMDVLNHSVAKVLNLYYFLGNRELAAILTPAVRKPIPDFKVRSMHEEMKVGFC